MPAPVNSPFPGMDPYLEQYWRDVHHRLITYACDQLQPQLPEHLRARVEERVFVETEQGDVRSFYPDLYMVERPGREPSPPGSAAAPREGQSGTAVTEPLVIHLSTEPTTQGCIEIVDVSSGNRVVTLIEFLSPTNKVPGPGRRLYQQKQQEAREAAANLVEIDLTRIGQRTMMIDLDQIPQRHRTTYQVCVFRAARPHQIEAYRAPLQEPLPTIRVPLRETDADVPLELQTLIEQCYRNGRYDDLNYRAEPQPPLGEEDAGWARELLTGKGLR